MNHQHMCDFAKNLQQVLEINPLPPLMEGLLRRFQAIPAEREKCNIEDEGELRRVATALVERAFNRIAFAITASLNK